MSGTINTKTSVPFVDHVHTPYEQEKGPGWPYLCTYHQQSSFFRSMPGGMYRKSSREDGLDVHTGYVQRRGIKKSRRK